MGRKEFLAFYSYKEGTSTGPERRWDQNLLFNNSSWKGIKQQSLPRTTKINPGNTVISLEFEAKFAQIFTNYSLCKIFCVKRC